MGPVAQPGNDNRSELMELYDTALPDPATVVPMYRVNDIKGAVERVRAAGGTATDPEQQPYGISSECTDDQGTRFYLGQL